MRGRGKGYEKALRNKSRTAQISETDRETHRPNF